jgi:hypothetical protein
MAIQLIRKYLFTLVFTWNSNISNGTFFCIHMWEWEKVNLLVKHRAAAAGQLHLTCSSDRNRIKSIIYCWPWSQSLSQCRKTRTSGAFRYVS